jgi:hypothetical protein
MRLVSGLALAATAAIVFLACGETQEVTPGTSTTPAGPSPTPASESPTPTSEKTPLPTPPADWSTYTDPELGFSFPQPPGLTASEQFFDLPAKNGNPPVQQRSVTLDDDAGLFVVGVSVVPNPVDLTVDEWVRRYVGWPSEPQPVAIAGEPGLLFPINAMGDRWPVVYFTHTDYVYSLGGNVYGAAGDPPLPPGISEADFQRVIDGFRFGS